jgi:hypothetical protein
VERPTDVVREETPARAARGGPVVLMSVATGHNVANLLRGGVLAELCDHVPGLTAVIASPFAEDPKFREEFARPGVVFEWLPPYRATAAEHFVASVAAERFLLDHRLLGARLQRDRARLIDPWRGRRALAVAKAALARLPVGRRTWFGVARTIARRRGEGMVFDRHRPSLLVTSSGGFLPSEVPLVCEARRRRVPHVVADVGWDNLASKYYTMLPADHLVVWNDQMRDAAVRYHDFRSDQVTVAGAVQFDPYAQARFVPSRREFLLRIGAAESAKVVTLATAGRSVYAGASSVMEHIAHAMRAGELGPRVHLLVRVHPRDDVGAYASWRGLPCVTVEKPLSQLNAVAGTPAFDDVAPTADERRHLAATLAHTDVLVNLASTTTLEACLFDTPVVNIGFDAEPGLPLPLSVRRYYRYEHYQPVLRAGAVRVARDGDELITALRDYLAHPERDRDARRAVAETLCGTLDGQAHRRVAAAIARMLPSNR